MCLGCKLLQAVLELPICKMIFEKADKIHAKADSLFLMSILFIDLFPSNGQS